MMEEPYYADELVTLYLGDSRRLHELWTSADVLVTDPPYGRRWQQGARRPGATDRRRGIVGDEDTMARDMALALWGVDRPAVVFGDPLIPAPARTRQVLVYAKPRDAGTKGAFGGFRRDIEVVYLVGPWVAGLNGSTSVLRTAASNVSGAHGLTARYGHPHAKPLDVMQELITRCPPGVVADPFAGAGSTLVAARMLGRRAVGVEVEERYAEQAARRLSEVSATLC